MDYGPQPPPGVGKRISGKVNVCVGVFVCISDPEGVGVAVEIWVGVHVEVMVFGKKDGEAVNVTVKSDWSSTKTPDSLPI